MIAKYTFIVQSFFISFRDVSVLKIFWDTHMLRVFCEIVTYE